MDEEFDEEGNEFIEEDFLQILKMEEIDYRIAKAINMLKDVADIIHISISWEEEDTGTNIYVGGHGNTLARKGMCEHYINRVKEEWQL